MVHRFFAKWVGPVVLAMSLVPARRAAAFCRTTTCSVANPPAFCARDPVTQCHNFGAPLFWDGGCVAYSIYQTGSPNLGLDFAATEELVSSAFAAWPAVDCFPSISVTNFGATSCGRPEFNRGGPNANAVIFHDLEWPHKPTQIGVTTVSFDTSTGRILGADIEVNTFGYELTPLQAKFIVMHEAGHFLGLDHSMDSSAVMYSQYDFSSGDTALAPDDIAAICSAYPGTRFEQKCDPQPHRGYATDCGGDVEGGCATQLGATTPGEGSALVLLVFAVQLRRRRSRVALARGRESIRAHLSAPDPAHQLGKPVPHASDFGFGEADLEAETDPPHARVRRADRRIGRR
jgi:hypothetical protein